MILLFFVQVHTLDVYVNNIFPIDNPQETYPYYSLPFCEPKDLIEIDQSLGESLSGDRKMNSLYAFNTSMEMVICTKNLTKGDIQLFMKVIDEDYYAEFYIFDTRLHDQIGKKINNTYYLKNRIVFNVFKTPQNGFIHANISEAKESDFIELQIKNKQEVEFSFSGIMKDVMGKNLKGDLLEDDAMIEEYLPLLIGKSLILLILIIIICYQLRRMLQRDFIRIPDDEESQDWKQIRQVALMPPSNRIVMSALLGMGIQFTILISILLAIGLFGVYEIHKGSIKSTGIILYAFTGSLNGYHTGRYYKYFGGKSWMLNIFIAMSGFPGSLASILIIQNIIAYVKGSTIQIPFQAIYFISFLFIVVYLPLTFIGAISGRLRTIDQLPKNRIKLQIPNPQKFRFQYGIIPFLISFIELHVILESTWGYQNFHQYFVIILSLLQLLLIVSCLSIIQTYRQLNRQDYRWQWSSFINGGSSALWIFLYLIYYFREHHMHGLIQSVYFFSYGILACAVLWIMLGSISFIVSLKFVIYIYSQNKMY